MLRFVIWFCFVWWHRQGKLHDVLFQYKSNMHPHCNDGDDYSAAAAAVVKIAWKQCDQTWWGRLLTQTASTCFISTSARLLVTNIVWDQKYTVCTEEQHCSLNRHHIFQIAWHKFSFEIHTLCVALAIMLSWFPAHSWFLVHSSSVLSSRSNQWPLRSSARAVHRVHFIIIK